MWLLSFVNNDVIYRLKNIYYAFELTTGFLAIVVDLIQYFFENLLLIDFFLEFSFRFLNFFVLLLLRLVFTPNNEFLLRRFLFRHLNRLRGRDFDELFFWDYLFNFVNIHLERILSKLLLLCVPRLRTFYLRILILILQLIMFSVWIYELLKVDLWLLQVLTGFLEIG